MERKLAARCGGRKSGGKAGTVSRSRVYGPRRFFAKGREGRRFLKVFRKIKDVLFHGWMPETLEMEIVHFRHRVIGRPVLESDAVGGEEDPGAIVSEPAMYEDFPGRALLCECEKLRELRVGR